MKYTKCQEIFPNRRQREFQMVFAGMKCSTSINPAAQITSGEKELLARAAGKKGLLICRSLPSFLALTINYFLSQEPRGRNFMFAGWKGPALQRTFVLL